ncbi:MAG: trypsin-like serine protease [Proteobacteria bacterium]|nr:trypsin-like serine protease [Pseudomonadota bacterium]
MTRLIWRVKVTSSVVILGFVFSWSSQVLSAIGGQKVLFKDYPFFLNLSRCGGVQIEDGVYLTAAHCVDDHSELAVRYTHQYQTHKERDSVQEHSKKTSSPTYFISGLFTKPIKHPALDVAIFFRFPNLIDVVEINTERGKVSLSLFDDILPSESLPMDQSRWWNFSSYDSYYIVGKGGNPREELRKIEIELIREKPSAFPFDGAVSYLRFIACLLEDEEGFCAAVKQESEEYSATCGGDSGSPVVGVRKKDGGDRAYKQQLIGINVSHLTLAGNIEENCGHVPIRVPTFYFLKWATKRIKEWKKRQESSDSQCRALRVWREL